jgi:hypothetical protein
LSSVHFYRTSKAIFILVLTIAISSVQVAALITPLQSVQAQDPIFGPPLTPSPATTPGDVNSASIVAPTGFPANSSIINNSSAIPVSSVPTNGSDVTNATLPLANDTLANGTLTDGTLPGGPLDNGTFPDANVTGGLAGTDPFAAGGINGTDPFAAGGGADLGGGGGIDPSATGDAGVGGAGETDPFGAGGLNDTALGATSPITPPPITKILSNNTGDSISPNVAVSGSDMFVAWEDTTGGNREILLISSLDGQNFTTVKNVSLTAGDSLNPRLAVSGNSVYLVWEDTTDTGSGQVMFAKSSDSGATFTVSKNLSNNTGDSTNPNVAISGNNVYVVWEDDTAGGSEIILVRSTNNGVNFAPSRNISNSPGESFDPRISISDRDVYVVWVDYSLGNSTKSDVMLIRSTNGGANFASAENLSNSPGESSDPRIALSENNVYVVWEDTGSKTGNSEVKIVRSADSGVTFTSAENLSNNDGISFDPRVVASGSNVYVVWEDTTTTTEPGAEGSSDIFLARSTNNGATFGSVQNLSNSPVESFDPYIAATRSKLFVLWSDDKDGNAEVIFTDKTRNITSPEEITADEFGAGTTDPFATGGAGATDPFATGGAGATDPFATGGTGLPTTDPSTGLPTTTDPSLQAGAGGTGLPATTDPSLQAGAGGTGLPATTDPSLQAGGGLPPITQ